MNNKTIVDIVSAIDNLADNLHSKYEIDMINAIDNLAVNLNSKNDVGHTSVDQLLYLTFEVSRVADALEQIVTILSNKGGVK